MKRIVATLFVVAFASFTLVGITSTAAEDDPEQQCEAQQRQALNARLADKPDPPMGHACDGITDAQWMAINAQLEPLRNRVVR